MNRRQSQVSRSTKIGPRGHLCPGLHNSVIERIAAQMSQGRFGHNQAITLGTLSGSIVVQPFPLKQEIEDLKCALPAFGCGMLGLRIDDFEGVRYCKA